MRKLVKAPITDKTKSSLTLLSTSYEQCAQRKTITSPPSARRHQHCLHVVLKSPNVKNWLKLKKIVQPVFNTPRRTKSKKKLDSIFDQKALESREGQKCRVSSVNHYYHFHAKIAVEILLVNYLMPNKMHMQNNESTCFFLQMEISKKNKQKSASCRKASNSIVGLIFAWQQ